MLICAKVCIGVVNCQLFKNEWQGMLWVVLGAWFGKERLYYKGVVAALDTLLENYKRAMVSA